MGWNGSERRRGEELGREMKRREGKGLLEVGWEGKLKKRKEEEEKG